METMNELPVYRNAQKLHMIASSLKAKKDRGKERLQEEIQRYEEVLCSIPQGSAGYNDAEISQLRQEITKRKEECELQFQEMEKKKKNMQNEKQFLEKMMQGLEERQANSEKLYPKVRYSLNLYKDISRIGWHSDCKSDEVAGYINTKSGIKTFRFDRSKQSQYFITNSLWDMANEN